MGVPAANDAFISNDLHGSQNGTMVALIKLGELNFWEVCTT